MSQSISYNDIELLKEFVYNLKDEIKDKAINKDDLDDLNIHINSIEAQLKRKEPKYPIIKGAIKIIKELIIKCQN